MKTLKLFILTMTLFFSACGESGGNASSSTIIGRASSIINSDPNATMAPSSATLKSILNDVATIVQTDVQNQNQKEATSFTKTTQYCDISGVLEYENRGTLANITKLEKFTTCKDEKYLQHGNLTINYLQTDSDGKYPKLVKTTVNNDYTVNDLLLKKGTIIESQISYNSDNSINTIVVKINGVVSYQYGNYSLKNTQESIKF